MLTEVDKERFWAKVVKTATCWLWSAATCNGYGMLRINRKAIKRSFYAHRLSWELNNGEIPTNMGVLHHCDVRPCVNPKHLFLGTAKDNVSDMLKKGRFRGGHPSLTEEQVKKIRVQRLTSTIKQLTFDYKVSKLTIINICKRRSWKHI